MSRVPNNWPNFLNSKPVNEKGEWSPEWQNLLQQFFSFAQNNLSNEGHVMPAQSNANITLLGAKDNVPNGTVWHDETNNVLKVKLNNVIKTITVT